MGNIKDIYDILKDLVSQARKIKNQEVLDLAMDLQERYFDFREENENLKDEVKALRAEVARLMQADLDESSIEYTHHGFYTIKGEKPQIPYCSACWKLHKLQVPLSQQQQWRYNCSNCKIQVAVVDINKDEK